jgi:hypothetical protein
MPPDSEKEITAADPQPPKIYIPACGALCDIFWWARRDTSPASPITPSPISKPQIP